MKRKLVFLGVGNTALAVRREASSYADYVGTTRSVERMQKLEEARINPVLIEVGENEIHSSELEALKTDLRDADVLVSYPPDKLSDSFFSSLAAEARRLVYISSTGVYGNLTGRIDEVSPVDLESASSRARLAGEDIWRNLGAVVLRAPGLYSASSGLINRLKTGTYRLPGDGSNYVSRIHLDDLAQIILASFQLAKPGTTYVVGDSKPATHKEVVDWLCQRLEIPTPSAVPLSEVHETLRGNRQICSDRVLRELGVKLRYPTFKEGYASAFS
jgi:NAD dependent epimerase/dehydratase family enzyme